MNRYQPEQFHLELNTRNLYLDFPDLMEINISSRLILEGTPAGSMLNGEIILLEGRYDKDFKLNLTQMTQKQRTRPPRRQPPGISFFDRMALDIDIIRRAPFWIDNNIAWLSISPDLTLHGTVYRPLISGRARVDSGTIMFQKKEFEVLKGIIDFVNPYAIEPVIDIIGETQVRSWRIQLSLSGTPDNLNLQLSSVPQESHADIIALLAFGKTTRELRRSGSGDGLSPSDILAGFVADSLQPHVKETIGLDSVEIQADKRSDTGTYGGTVTLGKELSRQLSVKYGVGVKDGETVQRVTTDYKILENFWLSGFQETGGNFGGGLKYRLEFR